MGVDDNRKQDPATKSGLARAVGRREQRKLRARKEGGADFWYWFGMFGMVGWAVALPTLGGIAVGSWLDRVQPGSHSWTLTFLFLGVALGCLNAWYWVQKEQRRR